MNDLLEYLQGLGDLQNEVDHALVRQSKDVEPAASSVVSAEIDQVIAAMEEVGEVERYLINRRSSGSTFDLTSEADVQDLLYAILRPWIHDLADESPGEKIAGRYTIKDFRSKDLKLIVEAKYVNNKAHGKSVVKELHDDIEMYANESDYDYIIFFLYDPSKHLRDVRALRRQIEKSRQYDGRLVTCRLVVRPI